MADYETFSLGDFPLESGRVLPDAKLAYKTYGQLNKNKTNAVLLCSYFTGNHAGYEFLIQPGRCFDPNTYFVISTNLFCNGLSSSLKIIPSIWGHFAGIGINAADTEFIDIAIKECLA